MTPATARLREILSDGAWHTREELIVLCGKLIEPGKAMRSRELGRRNNQRKAARVRPDNPIRLYSDEYYIAIGRRAIMVDSFSSLKGLEHRNMHGRRWVRDKKAHEALLEARRERRTNESRISGDEK